MVSDESRHPRLMHYEAPQEPPTYHHPCDLHVHACLTLGISAFTADIF